jgi:hypothetical protein
MVCAQTQNAQNMVLFNTIAISKDTKHTQTKGWQPCHLHYTKGLRNSNKKTNISI